MVCGLVWSGLVWSDLGRGKKGNGPSGLSPCAFVPSTPVSRCWVGIGVESFYFFSLSHVHASIPGTYSYVR